MQIPADIHRQLLALIEEGIREGRIHPEGSAEEHDGAKAARQLDEGRLFAAARSVSSLVRPGAWDAIRELAWEAGAPADVWSWDEAPAVPAPAPEADARW